MARSIPTLPFLLGSALLLAGCELPNWLGSSERDAPLPGQRVSILALDRGLTPDPAISDLRVLLPAPYVNQSWQQSGGSPAHAMYHLSLKPNPRTAWRADVGDGSDDDRQILAGPIVVGDRVFTMDSRSIVTAFDAARGRQVWRVDLELEDEDEGFFGGGIAHDAGRIFVTTGFARLFALDAGSGEVIWQRAVSCPMRAAPTVSGGRVFAITLDNRLYALAADDGRRLWEHSGIQENAGLLGSASPAVAGSVVVVPYSSGELFGLLVDNGRELWSETLSSLNRFDPLAKLAHIRGMPVIDRGMVLAISHAGRMMAIDIRRGQRVWDINLGGVQMPWVGGDFIFVLTNDAQVVCLTRREGRVRWVRPLPRFEDPENLEDPIVWVGPVLAGDRLIVAGSHGEAMSISPYTGKVLGYIELPAPPAVAPVVANDTLYFLTQNADLIAMR